jgi:hypothetical protein
LEHVKVAVTVTRIERFHCHRDQKIAFPVVAHTLAFRRMADSIDLVQRV